MNPAIQPTSSYYDIVVVGGGHAGCEAALASARMGCKTALVEATPDKICYMACNPSVGAVGKSNLVIELDALGGEIGRNADFTGINFRTLNSRKGIAVRALRVQCDRNQYSKRMIAVLKCTPNLSVIQGMVTGFQLANNKISGVILAGGITIECQAVILTPGTFLKGRIFIGAESWPGGRHNLPPCEPLSTWLISHGFKVDRFKTGTPPRLLSSTIDYTKMVPQHGENNSGFFSWEAERVAKMFHVEHFSPELVPWEPKSAQLPCYITQTTPLTHEIVRKNLCRSSLYGGYIHARGVRYCPSLEDKIVKYPDREHHHVFVEPEGRNNPQMYINGISNSLPREVQEEIVHSIPGLEEAKIEQYGYAIEYDYCNPVQLDLTLQSRHIENLYLAGQINGTTGYEEAAAQGFIAGVNAVMKIRGEKPIIITRDMGYIGVMIDDLTGKGVDEPYRIFTASAEYRLQLRASNAYIRLFDLAKRIGIISKEQQNWTQNAIKEIEEAVDNANEIITQLQRSSQQINLQSIIEQVIKNKTDPRIREEITARIVYRGYLERELELAEKLRELEGLKIPTDFNYEECKSLRIEARQKLSRIRPLTLAQASRIPGVTKSDIAVLAMRLHNSNKK
jgi:tRNA uridine 5-carboxymethylaminomethyl modification enzyme